MRRLLFLLLLAAALATALPAAALTAPLPGSSFDSGDGNQTQDAFVADWQDAWSAGRVTAVTDPQATDNCFIGGVKELTPNQWAFDTSAGGCTPGKSNVRGAFANPESTVATTFSHFAFFRNDT